MGRVANGWNPGETMTVNDLLKASVIASANDACTALGRGGCGQ